VATGQTDSAAAALFKCQRSVQPSFSTSSASYGKPADVHTKIASRQTSNHLSPAERLVWAELVRIAHPGLLARSDRLILEIAAKLVIRMRTTDAKTSELNALMKVLAKLGMTLAARLKMNLLHLDLPTPEPTKEHDPMGRA
jgi:hypothetical protein